MQGEQPLPPPDLMGRVGRAPPGHDQREHFLEVGGTTRRRIDELAPEGWRWDGRRALDFGCGVGRTLRYCLDDAERAEIWGCDIDSRSIAWLREHWSPPLHVADISEWPPLPHDDGYFDAIWGLSVFSHLDRNWAEWLLELRRVLADDGWLLLTFLGDGMPEVWDRLAGGEPYDEERVGMSVFQPQASWDDGGPTVFLSEWWIRARWGRAFSIERLATRGFRGRNVRLGHGSGGDQGYVLLRKRPGGLTPDDLRRPEPGEPREAVAALAEVERVRHELEHVYASRSWRSTRPLREGATALRERLVRRR